MGRPKVKIIDDSLPADKAGQTEVEEKKKKLSKKNVTENEGRLSPNAASSRLDEVERTRGEAESEPQGVSTEGAVSKQESEVADQSTKPEEQPTKQKKAQKPGKTTKVRSKQYQAISKDLDKSKSYSLTEGIELVKKVSYSKQVGTLEAHINTIQTGIRGLVSLPFASGKKLTILAFGKEAEKSGADVVGTDETIEEISKGKFNYDLVVTTPEWMPRLAKIARILGPRGLMPNPKNGTITNDLKKAVEGFMNGKTEYKTEPKAPVIHLGLGKLNQPTEELSANIKILIQTIGKTRVKKISLSPTQGPSVKLDLSSI